MMVIVAEKVVDTRRRCAAAEPAPRAEGDLGGRAHSTRRHNPGPAPAGRQATKDGLALLSDAFSRRLKRLTIAQQKELKSLLELIL
jgi:hypothetical protein